ncbi:MAG: hypothetical protein ACKO2L_21320 [Planctomycetaceae bacterium]
MNALTDTPTNGKIFPELGINSQTAPHFTTHTSAAMLLNTNRRDSLFAGLIPLNNPQNFRSRN